ncbi:MAG TPA: MFS transporter [Gammaproteobacteria bacterium]
MATLTGGTFLVALALGFGASSFQIGLLAAIPTLANLFQLLALYLLHKYANRKAIAVVCSVFARLPLLLIGFLPLLFPAKTGILLLISLVFTHYFFGALSGTSWSSWLKDLVPEEILGSYFSHRSRIIQIVSVSLSLIVAFALDYVKAYSPGDINTVYSVMFFLGGAFGLYGVYLIFLTPEPRIQPVNKNMIKLFRQPLAEPNFRNFLIFNSCWAFAVNLAAPFFTVYMLKMLKFPLSYVVIFSIINQVSSILFIRMWGRYSDKYSNKTVLRICAPIYLCCIFAWTFTTFPDQHAFTIPLLVLIHIGCGMALGGINLSLNNIGFKLAPGKEDAAVFLSARSLVIAFFAGIAPIFGGMFADFFSQHELNWNIEWKGPLGNTIIQTLSLQSWDFFFFTASFLGLFALYRLTFVKEEGEVGRRVVVRELSVELGKEMRALSTLAGLKAIMFLPFSLFSFARNKQKDQKAYAQE